MLKPNRAAVSFLLCLWCAAVCLPNLYSWSPSYLKNEVSFILTAPMQTFFSSGSANGEEEPERTSRFWDELSHVGLPQHLNVESLFEPGKSIGSTSVWLSPEYFSTVYLKKKKSPPFHRFFHFLGQCWAHQSCALWSEGVFLGEGQSLLNVDRAIYSGSTTVSPTRAYALIGVHTMWMCCSMEGVSTRRCKADGSDWLVKVDLAAWICQLWNGKGHATQRAWALTVA